MLAPEWRSMPFVRLLFPLIAGYLLSRFLAMSLEMGSALIGLLLVFLLAWPYSRWRKNWRYRFVPGLAVFLAFILLGSLLDNWRNPLRAPHHQAHFADKKGWLLARIIEVPLPKPKSVQLTLEIQGIYRPGLGMEKRSGLALVYVKSEEKFVPGDRIWLRPILQKPVSPRHPGGFDYAAYLALQNIHLQAFLQASDWLKAAPDPHKRAKDLALELRTGAIGLLKTYLGAGAASGLAAALIFGYRADLPAELVQSYANTGAIHVLAVSGLHTGILYLLLNLLFRPLHRFKRLRWLAPLLILAGLWLYALLAGLPPSVNRASAMCSMMVIASFLQRKPQIYNTLAATALVLLCLRPEWLFHIGFQLSFMAVLGIVLLQKVVYNMWIIRNRFLDYFWQLTAVSLAAQLLTLPLGLYYFHQFPTYFWLSNWLVIPLATVLLGGGLLVLAASPLPWLATLLGNFLAWIINFQNLLIQKIEALPGAVWGNWQLSYGALLVLYALFFCLSICWLQQSRFALRAAWLSVVLLLILGTEQQVNHNRQKAWVIYHIPGKTAMSLVQGRQLYVFGADSLQDQRYIIQPHKISCGIKNQQLWPHDTTYQLFRAGRWLIWQMNAGNSADLKRFPVMPVDWLLISGRVQLDTAMLATKFPALQGILLDGSNSAYYCAKYQQLLEAAGYRVLNSWQAGTLKIAL